MNLKQAIAWVKNLWRKQVADDVPSTSELAGNVEAILGVVNNAKSGTDCNIAANMLESFKERHSYLAPEEMEEFVKTLEEEILAKRRAIWLQHCENELSEHCN